MGFRKGSSRRSRNGMKSRRAWNWIVFCAPGSDAATGSFKVTLRVRVVKSEKRTVIPMLRNAVNGAPSAISRRRRRCTSAASSRERRLKQLPVFQPPVHGNILIKRGLLTDGFWHRIQNYLRIASSAQFFIELRAPICPSSWSARLCSAASRHARCEFPVS